MRLTIPRLDINQPLFRNTVWASGQPGWRIARVAGFTHYPKFSALINADQIPATDTNIDRLFRIADAIGFDRAQLFVGDAR